MRTYEVKGEYFETAHLLWLLLYCYYNNGCIAYTDTFPSTVSTGMVSSAHSRHLMGIFLSMPIPHLFCVFRFEFLLCEETEGPWMLGFISEYFQLWHSFLQKTNSVKEFYIEFHKSNKPPSVYIFQTLLFILRELKFTYYKTAILK